MQTRSAILVYPQVVRREVEIRLPELLSSHRDKVERSLRCLSNLFTTFDEVELPSEPEILEYVKGLTNTLDIDVREVHLSLEAVKSSLNKILLKKPPSDRKEQFVDGVIWANCLQLLEEGNVFLVSEDKAFYNNYTYSEGLVQSLKEEADVYSNKLYLHPNLDSLLQHEDQHKRGVQKEILPDFYE